MRIFLIILLLPISLFAQEKFSISGTVTDVKNGETLFGVAAYIKGTTNGSVTNEYGFYSVTAPKGKHTLVFSYMGFITTELEVDLNNNQKLNIELNEEENQIEEIVIVAEKESKATNIKTPQMSVNKLSTKTIKQIPAVLGEVDIVKSIQLLPGVTNAGEGSSGFNVRGGAEDQNLVLLDEAIIYNASHLFGFFSVFNADAIKDIKLYKGGIPSKFGGRVSSVLDIRQKDGNAKNFKLTGGIGLISSRLTAEGPTIKDKGSFIVSGRSSYAHLLLKLANNDNSANFYDLNFKTNYIINENNKLYLSGYLGNDVFNLANIFTNSYGNNSANLRWNHVFNDKLFSNVSLIYSRYDATLEINSVGVDWKSDINNYNIRYDLKYYLNDKIKADFGFSSIYYDFNPGELKPLNENFGINEQKLDDKFAVESAFYAGLEHKIAPKFTLQYGFRFSNFLRLGNQNVSVYLNNQPVTYNASLSIYEEGIKIDEVNYKKNKTISNFNNFEPRLAASYQLNKNTSVKASFHKIAQYLHLLSNTTSATPLDIWTPSGSFIKPQLGEQFAIGYFKNFKNDVYSLEVESYFKTIDNRIDYIDGADLIANNHIETEILSGESRTYGLELLLKKNKGKFTGWLAYTLSKSEQRTNGNVIGGLGINNGNWYNTPYDRTHDISLTGSYKLNNKWHFGSNFTFQTGRPVTYPNGQFEYNGLSIATYSERNANRLPAYHRIDISATLTPKKNKNRKWKSEWVFGIYNLYNRRNAASISFSQNNETAANEATRTAIFGMVPSVTYNFKF